MNQSNGIQSPQIRVISLNCWGLKYVSKVRTQRLEAIAQHLNANGSNYDIVALQEVWVESDFDRIKQLNSQHFPYSNVYYSGMIAGPGLAVLSRWPIKSTSLFRFPINGRPSAFFRGDWYVGKSVASAVILHPDHPSMPIELLNAHMHAPYGPGDAAYTCHRTAQAWEMARIANRAIKCGHMVIVVGDLNSRPDSFTHRLFKIVGGLSDSWLDKHGEFKDDMEQLSPQDQIKIAGTTCDNVLNTWRATRRPDEACRLDYVFYDRSKATVFDSKVSFTESVPGVGSFSDHFAIESAFALTPSNLQLTPSHSEEEYVLYSEILDLIEQYRCTSLIQAAVRNFHFWLSILILIGLFVGVFWAAADNRAYNGFIFMFIAVIVAVTGLLDGLMGFLFGRNEIRALKEFESEILLARSTIAGESLDENYET